MENMPEISREEMERLVKKAEKELQDRLARMTPEERAQAEMRAQKMIEEDRLANEQLLERASRILNHPADEGQRAHMERNLAAQFPNASPGAFLFCPHCGAKAESSCVCEYCGMPFGEK